MKLSHNEMERQGENEMDATYSDSHIGTTKKRSITVKHGDDKQARVERRSGFRVVSLPTYKPTAAMGFQEDDGDYSLCQYCENNSGETAGMCPKIKQIEDAMLEEGALGPVFSCEDFSPQCVDKRIMGKTENRCQLVGFLLNLLITSCLIGTTLYLADNDHWYISAIALVFTVESFHLFGYFGDKLERRAKEKRREENRMLNIRFRNFRKECEHMRENNDCSLAGRGI